MNSDAELGPIEQALTTGERSASSSAVGNALGNGKRERPAKTSACLTRIVSVTSCGPKRVAPFPRTFGHEPSERRDTEGSSRMGRGGRRRGNKENSC